MWSSQVRQGRFGRVSALNSPHGGTPPDALDTGLLYNDPVLACSGVPIGGRSRARWVEGKSIP